MYIYIYIYVYIYIYYQSRIIPQSGSPTTHFQKSNVLYMVCYAIVQYVILYYMLLDVITPIL